MTATNTRKLVVRALIVLGILILAFGLYVGISLTEHLGLVEGEPIAEYTDPTEAVVVIDVQKDLTSPGGKAPINPSLTDPMIQKINQVVDRAHAENKLVVYIRHEFKDDFLIGLFTGGALKTGTQGTEIDPRIHMVSDHVFVKNIVDSFSNPQFDLFLRENQVSSLVLTGIDAEACVDTALRSALSRGYRVTVISDAVASSSRERVNSKLEEFGTLGAKIVTTDEALERPEPDFYRAVLETLKLCACNVFMVGDPLEGDVLAANAQGIAAVWFNADSEISRSGPSYRTVHRFKRPGTDASRIGGRTSLMRALLGRGCVLLNSDVGTRTNGIM